MLCALAAQVPAQAPRVSAQALRAGTPGVEDTPLDIVMLVDESGSLSDADVAREVQAAGTIAQTPLNPRSRVTVVGFGGVNGVKPNQAATTVVCQPTITSGAVGLEYLAQCVKGLHRRTDAEGNSTDYAAALSQAMSYFSPGSSFAQQSPAKATRAIIMMTDGALDVSQDPAYLPDWETAAHHAVDLQLAAARAAGAQVWPLGFGTISGTDRQYLDYLAASGAQQSCDSRAASRPHATVVQNPSDALNALYALYAAAGCLGTSNGGSTLVPGGQTRWLEVHIPAIASDGAISVDKGNPGIRVDYLMPDGTTVTGGSLSGSTFQRSGQDTSVDVLHVTNPQSGTWRIRLTAPGNLSSQLVSVIAFWQGAVRDVIIASPPSARVGQPIKVTLSVLGANGPISDPATLQQISVQVSVAGDGLSGPVDVPVSNAGEGHATPTGAGDYTGTFTAPSTPGTLTFTGTAVGYGLHATQVPTVVQVGTAAALLQSAVQFTAPDSVLPGQSVHGQVLFDNRTGETRQVRLSLSAIPAFATIATPHDAVQVPSGSSRTDFTVTFAGNSPRGPASLDLKVVDAADPNTAYGEGPLIITVSNPPGLLARYGWELVGALILLALILLAAYARRRAHRAAVDVRGLYAMLRRDGDRVGAELKAPGKWAETFRFVILDEEGPYPRLDHPKSGDRGYVARRGGNGQVKVVTPAGEKYDISAGGPGEPLPSGLHLAFRDAAHAAASAAPPDGGVSASVGTGPGTPPRPGPPTPPGGPPAEPAPDPWL